MDDAVDRMIELAIISAPTKKNVSNGPQTNILISEGIVLTINYLSMITGMTAKNIVSESIMLYDCLNGRDDIKINIVKPDTKDSYMVRKHFIISPEARSILDSSPMKPKDIVVAGILMAYSLIKDTETASEIISQYPQFTTLLRRKSSV